MSRADSLVEVAATGVAELCFWVQVLRKCAPIRAAGPAREAAHVSFLVSISEVEVGGDSNRRPQKKLDAGIPLDRRWDHSIPLPMVVCQVDWWTGCPVYALPGESCVQGAPMLSTVLNRHFGVLVEPILESTYA